ncbi:MAG: hypothetical protein ACPGVH_04650 [Chitinophagales bacterium]
MSLINNFRNYTSDTIIDVTKKTIIPVGLSYFATAVVITLIMMPVFAMVFGMDLMNMNGLANIGNEQLMQEQSMRMAQNLKPQNIVLLFLVYLLMFFIMSWFMNFAINLIHRYTTTKEIAVSETLKESFSSMVFKIFFLFFLQLVIFIVLYIVLAMLVGLLMMATPVLGIIGAIALVLFLYIFMIKISLSLPILIISKKGIRQSIIDAYNAITYKKALKYFVYIFVITIVLFLMLFTIVFGLGLITGSLGITGVIISTIIQSAVGAIIITLSLVTLLAIFYKYYYKSDNENNLNLEENLIL